MAQTFLNCKVLFEVSSSGEPGFTKKTGYNLSIFQVISDFYQMLYYIWESSLTNEYSEHFSTSRCFFLIMINEKEIYSFHLWVKLKSTSWGFYGPVQTHWRSVLNEWDNTLRHPCRNDIQTSFDAISEILQPQPLFPIQPPPHSWISSHQSEQFGLWKWALLLLLTFSIFLSRIPQVPLAKLGPFPALQKHSHAFPMFPLFPLFALPLPLINENTRSCGLLSIWVEIQGRRGNWNHPVRLRCPWTSKLDPQKSAGIRN